MPWLLWCMVEKGVAVRPGASRSLFEICMDWPWEGQKERASRQADVQTELEEERPCEYCVAQTRTYVYAQTFYLAPIVVHVPTHLHEIRLGAPRKKSPTLSQ